MGAKKKQPEVSKKTEKKMQERIIEDKTFGLKNKNKSKTVQKYIKGVENNVRKVEANAAQKKFAEQQAKKDAKKEDAFLNSLFKSVTVVKQKEVEEGETAKTILCQFFKAGMCDKGDACEFSHDLNIEFNQGAFDIYTDIRDVKKGPDSEIHKIANEKEAKRNAKCQSKIICKFFMDAVVKKIYGWKWECPNGDSCHYKHCLPEGFIIPTSKDKMQEEMGVEDYMNLEEQIDEERERVSKTGIRVNDATFKAWREKRDEARQSQLNAEEKKKKSALTGLQLFKKQADLFKDDANAGEEKIRVDDKNQIEETPQTAKTDEQVQEELQNKLNGVEINTDLFAGENQDDLDNLDDVDFEDDDVIKEENNEIEEEEKDN